MPNIIRCPDCGASGLAPHRIDCPATQASAERGASAPKPEAEPSQAIRHFPPATPVPVEFLLAAAEGRRRSQALGEAVARYVAERQHTAEMQPERFCQLVSELEALQPGARRRVIRALQAFFEVT